MAKPRCTGCKVKLNKPTDSGMCSKCLVKSKQYIPTPEELEKLLVQIRSERKQLSPSEEYKRAIGTYRHPRVCKVH